MLAALRRQGLNQSQSARSLGRHRSTVCREVRRNSTRADGRYRAATAQERTHGRRSRSRRNLRFTRPKTSRLSTSCSAVSGVPSRSQVTSPDTNSSPSAMRLFTAMSGVTRRQVGCSTRTSRGARKRRRKRYGSYDSRGRLTDKRLISDRPSEVEARRRVRHWEADTVMGTGSRDCILTLVKRQTGLVVIGKLADRTANSVKQRIVRLIRRQAGKCETVTTDNGTEFHDYRRVKKLTGATFYFARPYHSWERGSSENAKGLIRQYLPKGMSMAGLSQQQCNAIARKLNGRPRKRLGFRTPIKLSVFSLRPTRTVNLR